MPPKKQRIHTLTAVAMVAVALVLDGAQALLLFVNGIPVVGTVLDFVGSIFITIVAAIIFGLWFALCDVNYFSGKGGAKKMLIALSSVVIELIPLIDAIPGITFGVVALIIQVRIEDRGMTGLGIRQVLGGTGQVAKSLRARGAGSASKALSLPDGDNEA